ncbi:hypothetical protein M569_04905 [Genlisea aurea]|uniref:C2H2-type domain-containing protein n=1 Tax=Genlisea aurea TaxID=192259 RepID=S8E2J5_9LAMI|nr:hypothetical protein M569_04905 [Genlisea aurea]
MNGEKVSWRDRENYHLHQTKKSFFMCNFCNRGFSNAQALGGHMNVHRRDRARLKESEENPRDRHEKRGAGNLDSPTGPAAATPEFGRGDLDLELRLGCYTYN